MKIPGYNPATTEDYDSGGTPPDGSYPVMIVNEEMRNTKAGGQMLALTLEVIDGPYKGRKLWDNLNVVNSSEVAQNIAHSKLKGYFHAVGSEGADDTAELIRKPLGVKIKTKEKNGFENTDIYILDYLPEIGTPIAAGETLTDDIPF